MTISNDAGAASGVPSKHEGASLDARLREIESYDLEERAAAYVGLHDEMRDRLEGGDAPTTELSE